MVNALCSSEL